MKRRLLSVKELADELGVHEDTIRRAYWNGTIPAERICRLLRFDLEIVRNAMLRRADSLMGQRSAQGGARSRPAPDWVRRGRLSHKPQGGRNDR
ncbi:MAG TPA: excisionase family DNA-binding protein [Nitrospira sp.]|nr:excisionase family DNA-binding protein [Nitrospira sp.]HUM40281.1 excisionase family DNA-binding protein [Nitrospira sp.]